MAHNPPLAYSWLSINNLEASSRDTSLSHITDTLRGQQSFAASQGQPHFLSHQIPTSPLQGIIAHLCQERRLRLNEVKSLV